MNLNRSKFLKMNYQQETLLIYISHLILMMIYMKVIFQVTNLYFLLLLSILFEIHITIFNICIDLNKNSCTHNSNSKQDAEKNAQNIDLRPGECIMHTLFYDFTLQATRKMEEVTAEPMVINYI